MSEDGDRYSVLSQIRRRLAEYSVRKQMHDSRDQILAELKSFYEARVASGSLSARQASRLLAKAQSDLKLPKELTVEERNAADLFQQLANRQASRPPNFEDLYRRKRELDAARDNDGRPAE